MGLLRINPSEPFSLPVLKVLTQGHFATVQTVDGVHEEDEKAVAYAEYGAGIMAEGGDSNTSKPWTYKTTPPDSAPVAKKRGDRKIPYKWWTKTKVWRGMTDRSRPAHYMAAARRYIRKNWNSHVRKAINTVIYRRAK